MSIEEKNQLVLYYINSIKEQFDNNGYPIKEETYQQIIEQYLNSTKSIEEIKEEIDLMVNDKIESLRRIKNSNKDISYYSNAVADDRESKTFTQIKQTYEKVQNLLDEAGLKVFVSGGSVPYLLLNQDSNRLHDDIDTVCRMEDIIKIREVFKKAGLYNQEWDSITYAEDDIDYGFETKIDGVPFGVFPFTYDNGIITQYTYDPYNKHCKIKNLPIETISDYVMSYKGVDGKRYDTMSLEIIKLTKDNASRPKDLIDSKKIDEIGVRPDVMSRITMYNEVQNRHVSELHAQDNQQSSINDFSSSLEQEGPKLVRKLPQQNNNDSSASNNDGKINLTLIIIISLILFFVAIMGTYIIYRTR